MFEIVASPSEEVSSINFQLTDNVGLIDFQLGAALSEWTVQTNTPTPNLVSLAGFGAVDGSQNLAVGQETVLASFVTSLSPDFSLDGIVLNDTAQTKVSYYEIQAVSNSVDPSFYEVAKGADLYLSADKMIDLASDSSISAFDALQALRLAVGLAKSDGTVDWHDYAAADINQDGRVGADDALNILKFVVGLTDGPAADWVFVDANADYSGINRQNTNYEKGVSFANVGADTSVDLLGILVGDVDGSYSV